MTQVKRNIAFDVIKGIAIIAVVLYHYGLCPHGYLGVDIFLVIAGFFTAKSMWRNTGTGRDKYIYNRILRLLPLLLIAEIVILAYGLLLMMPDDFENVSQSIIASNFFANNVLADITTRNYWDIINEYKPLMHTWYLGVLMQFYVIFVFSDLVIAKLKGKSPKAYLIFWAIFSIASLALFLSNISNSSKFYEIPFRIFEFGVGCIAFYISLMNRNILNLKVCNVAIITAYFAILAILFINIDFIGKSYILLLTVILTFILVYLLPQTPFSNNKFLFNKPLAVIGISSFSLYIWHQIVFALTRYSFTTELKSMTVFLIVMAIVVILTYFSYRYVERMKFSRKYVIIVISSFIALNACAFTVYARAGIFYDIPELEVKADNIQKGMWSAYCDSGYQYDRPFLNSGKQKWLVVGNSFGRDFVNIIRESAYKDSIDLSYTYEFKDNEHINRIREANCVFISNLGATEKLIREVKSNMASDCKLVIVGPKNFGINNGQVFRRRRQGDYFKSTLKMQPGYEELNEKFKSMYPDNFLDLIEIARMPDGNMRVFSDDGRFISQDCRHLTKAGAQFYAGKIDWSAYL